MPSGQLLFPQLFLFDWYWYNDGPYLEAAIDEGFLNASNNHRLKFALMWANHDWLELQPASRGKSQRLQSWPDNQRVLTINCWNEWTEGSYLEPDMVHGMRYLEAIRDVFAAKRGLSPSA